MEKAYYKLLHAMLNINNDINNGGAERVLFPTEATHWWNSGKNIARKLIRFVNGLTANRRCGYANSRNNS